MDRSFFEQLDRDVPRTAAQLARRRAFDAAAAPVLAELRANGVNTDDFGTFTSLYPLTFDFRLAAPILIRWLPRLENPDVIDAIARSLTSERSAQGEGARALIDTFKRIDEEATSTKWVIGNALSTLARRDDADEVIALLSDRRHGRSRQMLCDALTRTKDPRAAEILVTLLDDDDVNGHAILALRRLGRWKAFPFADIARPTLEALVAHPASPGLFVTRQARKALQTMDSDG